MKAQEHKKKYHSKKPPVCTVAPDGYQINKPGSSFDFFRPPSSTDERVIVPLYLNDLGNTKFIPDEYFTMPEQLRKLDVDPDVWSNWATSTKERAADLPVYKIGPISGFCVQLCIGIPWVCYMQCHNNDVVEKFKKEALTDLNKNVLKSEGDRDAKLQQADCSIGREESSRSMTIEWLAIPLTDSDATILNQSNWQYRYIHNMLEEIPKGEICLEGSCFCFGFEIPCGLYYY